MMVPYQLGFGLDPQPWDFLFALEVLIDVSFGADLTLQFFSWRVQPVTGDTLLDCGSNARDYLCSWFLLDLLSTVPFDRIIISLDAGGGAALRTLRVLRIVRLLKLLKLTRLVKLQDRAERLARVVGVGIYNSIGGVAQLLFLIAFATHIIACLFHGLTLFTLFGEVPERASASALDDGSVVDAGAPMPELFGIAVEGGASVLNGGTSWATLYGETNSTDASRYASAVYYTVTSLLSAGPGDIVSQNDTERLFSVILMVLGACLFGIVVAGVSRVVEQMSASSLAYQRKMNEVNEWASSRKLPNRLKQRIGRFYQYLLSRVSLFSENAILQDLSTSLRNEVVAWSNGKIIYGMEPFRDADPTLVTLLVTRMRPLFHMRQDVVFREEEQGKEVFFLVRGAVQLVAADPGDGPLQYLRRQARRKRRDELLDMLGFFDDPAGSSGSIEDGEQGREHIQGTGGRDGSEHDQLQSKAAVRRTGSNRQARPKRSYSSNHESLDSGELGGSLLDLQAAFLQKAPSMMRIRDAGGQNGRERGSKKQGAGHRSGQMQLSVQGQGEAAIRSSPRSESHTSATLGTVDPRHVPRVEQEGSESDSGSSRSGWTGYSFLTERPGDEKSRPPQSKAERNARASIEAERRRRASLLQEERSSGNIKEESQGKYQEANPQRETSMQSFRDAGSVIAPHEGDRDLDGGIAPEGKTETVNGDSTKIALHEPAEPGVSNPGGQNIAATQGQNVVIATAGALRDAAMDAKGQVSSHHTSEQPHGSKPRHSAGDGIASSDRRKVATMHSKSASSRQETPWTSNVSVDRRSTNEEAMNRLRDSRQYQIISGMQQTQALGHALANIDTEAALMHRRAARERLTVSRSSQQLQHASVAGTAVAGGSLNRPPTSPPARHATRRVASMHGRELSASSGSGGLDMQGLNRTQSWTEVAQQMKSKASKLRMDFARSAQGIHSMLGSSNDDRDRDSDLRYRSSTNQDTHGGSKYVSGNTSAGGKDDGVVLGMVAEEDEDDEENADIVANGKRRSTGEHSGTIADSSMGSKAHEVNLADDSRAMEDGLGLHSERAATHGSSTSRRSGHQQQAGMEAPSNAATRESTGTARVGGDSHGSSDRTVDHGKQLLAPRKSATDVQANGRSFRRGKAVRSKSPSQPKSPQPLHRKKSKHLTPKMSFKLFGSVMARPHVPSMGMARQRLAHGLYDHRGGLLHQAESNGSISSSDTGELIVRVKTGVRKPGSRLQVDQQAVLPGGIPSPRSGSSQPDAAVAARASVGNNRPFQRDAVPEETSRGIQLVSNQSATGGFASSMPPPTLDSNALLGNESHDIGTSDESSGQDSDTDTRPASQRWGKQESGRLIGAPAGDSLIDPHVNSDDLRGGPALASDSSLEAADAILAPPSMTDFHIIAEPMSLADARKALAAEQNGVAVQGLHPSSSMHRIVSSVHESTKSFGLHLAGAAGHDQCEQNTTSESKSRAGSTSRRTKPDDPDSRRTLVERWPSNESFQEREAMLLLGESSSSDESAGVPTKRHGSLTGDALEQAVLAEFLVPEVETEQEKQVRLRALQQRRMDAQKRRQKRKLEKAANRSKAGGAASAEEEEDAEAQATATGIPASQVDAREDGAGNSAEASKLPSTDEAQPRQIRGRRQCNARARPMTFAEAKRARKEDGIDGSSRLSGLTKSNKMSMSSRRIINTRDITVRQAWKHGPLYAVCVFTDGRHFGDVGPLLNCHRPVGARASTVCDMQTISIDELLLVLQDFPSKLRELRKLAKQRRNAYRRHRILLAAQLHVGAATTQEDKGRADAEAEVLRAVTTQKILPKNAELKKLFFAEIKVNSDDAAVLSKPVRSVQSTRPFASRISPTGRGNPESKSVSSKEASQPGGGGGGGANAAGQSTGVSRHDARHADDDDTLPPGQRPLRPGGMHKKSGTASSTHADATSTAPGHDDGAAVNRRKSWAQRQYEVIQASAKNIGSVVSGGISLLSQTLKDDDEADVDEHDDSPAAVAKRAVIESVAPAPRAILPHILLNDAPAAVRLLPEGLLPTMEEEENDDQQLLRTLRQVEIDADHVGAVGINCCAACLACYVNNCGCECRYSGQCWCPAWCACFLHVFQCACCACSRRVQVAPDEPDISGGFAAAAASHSTVDAREMERCSLCCSLLTCARASEFTEEAAILDEMMQARSAAEKAQNGNSGMVSGIGAIFGTGVQQTIQVPKEAVQREASDGSVRFGGRSDGHSREGSGSGDPVAQTPGTVRGDSSAGNKKLRVRRGSTFTAADGTQFSSSLRKIGYDPDGADEQHQANDERRNPHGSSSKDSEHDIWDDMERWLLCRLDARCCCCDQEEEGGCCGDPTAAALDKGAGTGKRRKGGKGKKRLPAHKVTEQRHLYNYGIGTQLVELISGPIVEDVETPSALSARWIIWSDSPGKARWDLLVLSTVLFTMFQVPFYIGFDLDIEVGSAMYVLERVIDFMFVIDIFLSARSTYVDEESQLQVSVPSLMCWNYVTSSIWVDILSSVPWDLLIPLLLEGNGDATALRTFKLLRTLRLVRLLRLLRLLRLFKVTSYVKGLSMSMFMSPGMVRLLTLSFQVMFSAHVLGCLWHFVTIVDDDTEHSWMIGLHPALNVGDSLTSRYLASIYWAVSTLTTVGYGDIVPHTDSETIAAIFITVIGASMFGYIIGSIAAVLTRLDPAKSLSEGKLRQVDEYLRDKNLDPALSHRVLVYYDKLMKRKSAFNEDAILAELSGSLRRAVVLHLNRDIIGSISFFRGASEGLIYHVVSVLRPQFAAPGEYVFREGEQPFDMFFLTDGICEVVETVEAAPTRRTGRKGGRKKSKSRRHIARHGSTDSGMQRGSVHSIHGGTSGSILALPSPIPGHRRRMSGSSAIAAGASIKGMGGRFASGGSVGAGAMAADSGMSEYGGKEIAAARLEVVHEQLDPGSYFGELSLLLGIRQPVGVRAKTHCSLFALSREELKDLVDRFPLFGKRVEQSMRRFLRSVVRDRRRRRKLER